ncbi:MAG: shikimate kinase [Clostridiales bacterium]|nr:shikimate kinase [Clostridiales bacterium]
MILTLCGMMGAGKTTVGKKLADITDMQCVDTDAVIEEKYGKITDIFDKYGEEYFRALETETVQSLCEKDEVILSVGGGLVLRKANVELLKSVGKIVYLRAKKETLVQRLRLDDSRPLLKGEDVEKRIEKLLCARADIYERVADYTIDVDGKNPETIALEIVKNIKK